MDANTGDIDQDEFEEELSGITLAILLLALLLGSENKSEAAQELIDAARAVLAGDMSEVDTLKDDDLLSVALTDDERKALNDKISVSETSTLAGDIYTGKYADNVSELLTRLGMWGATALTMFGVGELFSKAEQRKKWRLGVRKTHCDNCLRLDGQVHTSSAWAKSGYYPGFHLLCGCGLDDTDEPENGGF
jgi:hypothetical protein